MSLPSVYNSNELLPTVALRSFPPSPPVPQTLADVSDTVRFCITSSVDFYLCFVGSFSSKPRVCGGGGLIVDLSDTLGFTYTAFVHVFVAFLSNGRCFHVREIQIIRLPLVFDRLPSFVINALFEPLCLRVLLSPSTVP